MLRIAVQTKGRLNEQSMELLKEAGVSVNMEKRKFLVRAEDFPAEIIFLRDDDIPQTVAIDTWGVDYVLLDKDDKILGKTYGYRDSRTNGMDEEVYKIISLEDLNKRTGIQKAIFNTIYQWIVIYNIRQVCVFYMKCAA